MTATPQVAANRKRKLESGLITQAQYDNAMQARGPEYIAPLAAYLCLPETDFINGQTFHVEKGVVSTYWFGEDRNSLTKDGDGMFTLEELEEGVPRALLDGVPPVVPIVRRQDAQKAGA